ncbi:MAG: twin-arginine translocation signal domain-containing protein, partial [Chloroflexi bacterium]
MARDGPFAGHPHFWERAMSRRQFLAASAAASGAA